MMGSCPGSMLRVLEDCCLKGLAAVFLVDVGQTQVVTQN